MKSATKTSASKDKIAPKVNSSDGKMPIKKNDSGPKTYGKSGKGGARF